MSPSRPFRIFLSYAKEDAAAACTLRDELERQGHRPWLDTHDLVGGQRWEFAIREALRESDLVVLLVSDRSTNKRGYFQREIRLALDLWEEKLESDIFVVPVRLEACRMPERLRPFQWVDLFEADGTTRLLRAISVAMRKAPDVHPVLPYKLESVLLSESSTDLRYDGNAVYPRLVSSSDVSAIEPCNQLLADVAVPLFRSFLTEEAERNAKYTTGENTEIPSVLRVNWMPTLQTEKLLSIRFDIYRYGSGGAHGNAWFQHLNFVLAPFREFRIGDLFASRDVGLPFLRDWCKHEIAKQSLADFGELLDYAWIETGTSEPETFGFNLGDRALTVYFGEYSVGPYSWGPRKVDVPYTALAKFAPESGPYAELLAAGGLTSR